MRILYIIPGSGGTFYCQNCQRDLELVKTLRDLGHDVVSMPLYLPLTLSFPGTDPCMPQFFGAVSLYLRYRYPSLKKLPQWFWKLMDSRQILRFAAYKAGHTRADGLGQLTVSMLRGENGNQADELARLIEWLKCDNGKFDIVCLSNALLLGLAAPLRRALGVPIVCWLQDENVWPDKMSQQEASEVWKEIKNKVDDVDLFVSVSASYSELFSRQVGTSLKQVKTVYPGINPSCYRKNDPLRQPPTIGFMARMADDEGFGLFCDAFQILRQRYSRFAHARMYATGGLSNDRDWYKTLLRKIARFSDQQNILLDPLAFERDRASFLQQLTILSVPALKGEAFGLYIIEAMATGIAVVQPEVGAFPEILKQAGCGLLYKPNKPEVLAATWANLLDNPDELLRQSQLGQLAVAKHFTLNATAKKLSECFASL